MQESQSMNYMKSCCSQNFVPQQNVYVGRRAMMMKNNIYNNDCQGAKSIEQLNNKKLDFSLISQPIQLKNTNETKSQYERFEIKVSNIKPSVRVSKRIIRPKTRSKSRSRSKMKSNSIKFEMKASEIQEEQCSIDEEDEDDDSQFNLFYQLLNKENNKTKAFYSLNSNI